MTTPSVPEPPLPENITPGLLDADARRDLRGLQKDTADTVARHLVAAGRLVDEDPALALEHARFARKRASRIALVREAAGIAAYHAGEWNEALGELRAARRMGGGPGHLAVMADIERALGRPERALEIARGPEVRELGRAEAIELTIVVAGARRDLGELDAAVITLQIPELDPTRRDPWSSRLFYAYADNLLAAGRESDALQWFARTVDADEHGETDAVERIAELTGEALPDEGIDFDVEDALDADDDDADDDDADDDDADDDDADDDDADDDDADDDDADDDDADDDDADDDDADDDDADDDDADDDDADDDDADDDDADDDTVPTDDGDDDTVPTNDGDDDTVPTDDGDDHDADDVHAEAGANGGVRPVAGADGEDGATLAGAGAAETQPVEGAEPASPSGEQGGAGGGAG